MPIQPPNPPERNMPVKFVFPFWFKVSSVIIVVLLAGFLGCESKERKEENERLKRARIEAAHAQLGLFKTPLAMYNMDLGSYPTTKQGLLALRNPPADLPNPKDWNGPYIDNDVPLDPWKHPYKYISPGKHNPDYDLWSLGSDGIDGSDDDIFLKHE